MQCLLFSLLVDQFYITLNLELKYLPFMLFSISVCVLGESLDMVVNIYVWWNIWSEINSS